MNSQLWSFGTSFPALPNMAPVSTSQLWSYGTSFGYIFPENTAPNNFWLLFE